jgi:hypothetical protein
VRSPAPVRELSVLVGDLAFGDARIDAHSIRVRYPGLIPVDENRQ